jgi:hypothetical protein
MTELGMNRPEFESQHLQNFIFSQYDQSRPGTNRNSVPLLLGGITEGKTAEALC